MPDLLIELFSEEIPARMQGKARDDLKRLVTDGLVEAGLNYAAAHALSTPRRLVLAINGLSATSRAQREERKGPAVGAPEAALQGFLRSTGLTLDQLERRAGAKGEAWFAVIEKPGRGAADIVAEVLEAAIRSFPWPKSMRWGAGSLRWVRPLHGVLCILTDDHGAAVVPLDLDGIRAGTLTRGHRFLAPEPFSVSSFDDYVAKLKRAFVLLDPEERASHIWHDATNAAFAAGLDLVEDKGLLAEVAGLVEWPVVLIGRIDEAFLDLPAEVLQTSMREHQKFFSARNPLTGRIEAFVTVANTETADHGATILAGNQKVLSARLSDAKFFWQNDLRMVAEVGMEGMARGLADVTFHHKLGSQADRVTRIEALAREIAPHVGAAPDLAAEAARICKADLQSQMVGEFPELQGTMGVYYARAAGHDDGVPEACKEHYQPLGPSDAVPTHPVSVAVALADKIDTLTGFWAIDEKPTGSKDPYALRRAALGVIRLVLGNEVRIFLHGILADQENRLRSEPQWAYYDRQRADFEREAQQYDGVSADDVVRLRADFEKERSKRFGSPKALKEFAASSSDDIQPIFPGDDLLAFLHDRLKVHLRDQGIRHDVIDACLAMPGNDDLTLLVRRATALAAFLKSDDGTNLLQGFKRANNILTQAEAKDGVEYSFGPDPKFAETEAERALFAALDTAEATIAPALKTEDFAAAMAAMAALRAPIDAFFDQVQVNADNQTLRRNRLNLLSRIRQTCLAVADLTRIEG